MREKPTKIRALIILHYKTLYHARNMSVAVPGIGFEIYEEFVQILDRKI